MLNIEIRGTGNHNKGAEMMLLTILKELKAPGRIFIIQPNTYIDGYDFYAPLGLYPKANLSIKGIDISFLLKFLPLRIKKRYGLYYDSDIQVLLDASGFSFSDQWGIRPARKFLRKLNLLEKNNAKVFLLPQSFGPFKKSKLRKLMQKIIYKLNKIYVRDEKSLYYLKSVTNLDNTKFEKYPDFTCLLEAKLPNYFDKKIHQICIIPNSRIVDKSNNSAEYFTSLIYLIKQLQKKNLSPYFLIFGGEEDYRIAQSINNRITNPLEIIDEKNPILLKGLISKSLAIIGSRYHGIISGLYEGVPTFGFGWSHKYKKVFEEFNFNNGFLSFPLKVNQLNDVIYQISTKEIRKEIKENLKPFIKDKKSLSRKLFKEINTELKKIEK